MKSEFSTIDDLHESLRIRRSISYYLYLVGGIFCGAIAALFLSWFMHYLIQSSDMTLLNSERNHILDFVRVKRTEQVQRKDRTPQRPQLSKSPEVPQVIQGQGESSQQLAVSALPVPISTQIDIGQNIIDSSGEGEYMPIVKVAPMYPHSALSRHITGNCLVEYTVTTTGAVKDVVVIEEQCVDKVFHKASIEAALRFKYKPRVIGGEPVEVRRVRNRFRYQIKE